MSARTILFVCCVMVQTAFANWGGWSSAGGGGAGDLDPRGMEQVEMVSESLSIDLYDGFARVAVRYELQNTGEAVVVNAGFPCLSRLCDYSITADDSALSYSKEQGQVRWFPPKIRLRNDPNLGLTPITWLTSSLHFNKGQKRTVSVSYKDYYYSDGGGVTPYYTEISAEEFHYFLLSGASWKGPIKSGIVRIKAAGVDPGSLTLEPKVFTRADSLFTWRFSDLEPTLENNIAVNFNDSGAHATIMTGSNSDKLRGWYHIRGTNYYFDQHGYKASASSTLAGYPAVNVADFNEKTAWVEGKKGPGIGESLTLTMKIPVDAYAIGILPGYFKSDTAYFNNNRIAKIKVTVNDSVSREYDLRDEYHFLGAADPISYQFMVLPPGTPPLKRVTLTILGVYKGIKFDDTAIGEVLIRKKLKERPAVGGGR